MTVAVTVPWRRHISFTPGGGGAQRVRRRILDQMLFNDLLLHRLGKGSAAQTRVLLAGCSADAESFGWIIEQPQHHVRRIAAVLAEAYISSRHASRRSLGPYDEVSSVEDVDEKILQRQRCRRLATCATGKSVRQ